MGKGVQNSQKGGPKLPISPGFGQETPNPSGDSNTKTSGSYRFGGGGVQNRDFGVKTEVFDKMPYMAGHPLKKGVKNSDFGPFLNGFDLKFMLFSKIPIFVTASMDFSVNCRRYFPFFRRSA